MRTGSYSATIGFNAVRNGVNGVVTAGHFATSGNTINNAMGTTIGTTAVSQYNGIDAAFIPFANQNSMQISYRLVGSYTPDDRLTNYYPSAYYLVGQVTYKIGLNTSYTTGNVVSTGNTFTVNGQQFTNQIEVSNTQRLGDSGGPVYAMFAILQTTLVPPKTILGIATFATAGEHGFVSPVWNIMNAFSLEPYLYPLQYSYVSSTVGSPTVYSPGTATNAGNLVGQFPDGNFARIYGGVANAGGHIICQLNKASKGEVLIFARSASANTQIHVYVSTSSNGPWTEITNNKLVPSATNPTWISCGSYNTNCQYIGIAAIHENGRIANIYIDTITES